MQPQFHRQGRTAWSRGIECRDIPLNLEAALNRVFRQEEDGHHCVADGLDDRAAMSGDTGFHELKVLADMPIGWRIAGDFIHPGGILEITEEDRDRLDPDVLPWTEHFRSE
jgi:hypothetical protein